MAIGIGAGGGMGAVGGLGGTGGFSQPAVEAGSNTGPGSVRDMFARDTFQCAPSGGG